MKERARQPFIAGLLGSGCVFFLAIVFSRPLWLIVSAPVVEVLRSQGIKPPNLVALSPWEQFNIIYLELPLLVTAWLAYPYTLLLAWRALTSKARAFAPWSAALYILGFLAGYVAWRSGSLGMLLQIMPNPENPAIQNRSVLSISHCFKLLAASTLGVALLLQVPVVAFYGISGAIQKTHRAGHSKHP